MKNAFSKLEGRVDGNFKSKSIFGWLASEDRRDKRVAVILIDGREIGRATADMYRADLAAAGINDGAHAFRVAVPPSYRSSGARRWVELVDGDTGRLIYRCRRVLGVDKPIGRKNQAAGSAKPYRSFEEYLAYSMLQPQMTAPFKEEQKRVLASMEGVGRYLRNLVRDESTLISVVMPVFNRAEFVTDALMSLLRQTYQNFEVVVVDDGSTDNTCEVVRAIKDERIRLIETGENRGSSVARNVGVAAARGDWVAYLDSDNWADPEWLETVAGAFVALPDADALYTAQTTYVGMAEKPSMVRFGALNRSLLQHRNYVDMGAFVHRRQVHSAVGGFNVDLRRGVDWDYILRIVETHRVYSAPVLGPNYRYAAAANAITSDAKAVHFLREVHLQALAREAERNAVVGELADPVSIVIPNFEALDSLRRCIESIVALGQPEKIEIIVVDNASGAETREYLGRIKSAGIAKVLLNDVNYGFSHAVNQGAALAGPGRDLLLLNNDAVLTGPSLAALQRVMRQADDIAVVMPQQVVAARSQSPQLHVPFALSDRQLDVNLSAHHGSLFRVPCFHDGGPIEIAFSPFFCTMIRRSAFDRIGGLDAEFGRHFRSDRTFCSMVRSMLNMKVMYAPDAVVYHEHQASTHRLRQAAPDAYRAIYEANAWEPQLAADLGFRRAAWD